MTISAEEIKGYLGPPKVYPEEARKELLAGVATGMAWTEMGGEVLFIEATLLPGGSGLTLTGQRRRDERIGPGGPQLSLVARRRIRD